ncbi:MAG: T9SS type A sorting domain-containing protein, partial [Cryomorphaceae bacterium]
NLASDPFELILSTSDLTDGGEMNIFPVPSRGEVNIDLPAVGGESLLHIYSADGRTIEKLRINTSESRIITVQTGSWAPGAYIVQLISGADVQTGRIVKVD